MGTSDLKTSIKHFSHPHTLKLVEFDIREYNSIVCYCCRSVAASSTIRMYVCPYCSSGLCLVCAELGESIERHALHPRHPRLKLVENPYIVPTKRRACHGCPKKIPWHQFSYQCDDDQCDFELHVQCAHSLKPVLQLPSISHPHSLALALIPWDYDVIRRLYCESCHSGTPIPYDTHFLRCVPCNVNFHISCQRGGSSIPETIMYLQGHPQHLLSLSKTYTYWSCDVCYQKRDWPEIPVYTCFECNNFTAHPSCVFQSSLPCPFSNLVTKVVLAHLSINDGQVPKSALCQACKKPVLNNGLLVYGCQYCNLFVHESCIRWWLQQPLVVGDEDENSLIRGVATYDRHHKNPLVLVLAHGAKGFRCACCSKNCTGFMFQKKENEKFVVHLECMFMPLLELIGHDHPVTLLQRSNVTKNCYLHCIPCRKDFEITESSCRFPQNLLLHCHFHPLTLVPKIAQDCPEQCYCDICEDKRDPDECLYYCAECKFEVQIGCIGSKLLHSGADKLKEVQFVTLQEVKENVRKVKTKTKVKDVFFLNEELLLLSRGGDKELNDIFQASSKMTWENFFGENRSGINDFSNNTIYSDEPFKTFIRRLNSTSTIELEKLSPSMESLTKDEFVRVGDYLVPLNFEEILETLFDKYGDFGAKSTCSRKVKQYLFVGLCATLQNMCNTKVVSVTESLLIQWWSWIAVGKTAGFEIQFALESLNQVVLAHFGLEADKYAIGELRTFRQQIKELPEEIEKLERELDEKRRKLKEAEIKEKELREVVFRVRKSPLMNKCLKEAENLACKTVGESFLPPSY